MFKKIDIAGLAMAAGVGIVTGMIYFCGKLSGKGEAYGDIVKMLESGIKEAEKTTK